MNKGYVKLWRKSLDSTIFANEGLWKLFCLCLMKASHQGYELTIPGILKPIKLDPGQFLTGRYSLHEDYHQANIKKRYSRKAAPTAYTLIRWLQNLQYMQSLSIKTYNKYSIITVINWPQYQAESSQSLDTSKNDTSLTLKQAEYANSEHQKSLNNQKLSGCYSGIDSDCEQQVSNRRASSEHKQECIKNVKEYTVDLYDFYIHEIKPFRKSKQRAVSNIKSHLKNYSFEVLKQSILNYKTTCKDSDPQFRKDPANYFGKSEPYFKDFLPDNFQSQAETDRPKIREITRENIGALYEN